MYLFMIFSFVVLINARPQGYDYARPFNSFSAINGPTHGSALGVAANNGQGGIFHNGVAPNSAPQLQHYQGLPAAPQTQFSNGLVAPQQNIVQQHYQSAPLVTKHFYIHVAPEETAEEAKRNSISAGPAHKHYHVVFIKAPHQTSKAAALSIAQAQTEEKTIIYVLSKKSDAADVQTALQQVPQKHNKPEVFFIKYQTEEEAAHAQKQIQAQYDKLGGTSQITNEGTAPVSSVIGALGTSASNIGAHSHANSLTSGVAHQSSSQAVGTAPVVTNLAQATLNQSQSNAQLSSGYNYPKP